MDYSVIQPPHDAMPAWWQPQLPAYTQPDESGCGSGEWGHGWVKRSASSRPFVHAFVHIYQDS